MCVKQLYLTIAIILRTWRPDEENNQMNDEYEGGCEEAIERRHVADHLGVVFSTEQCCPSPVQWNDCRLFSLLYHDIGGC